MATTSLIPEVARQGEKGIAGQIIRAARKAVVRIRIKHLG